MYFFFLSPDRNLYFGKTSLLVAIFSLFGFRLNIEIKEKLLIFLGVSFDFCLAIQILLMKFVKKKTNYKSIFFAMFFLSNLNNFSA